MVNKEEKQEDTSEGHFCYFDRRHNVKFSFDVMNLEQAKICEDQTDECPPALDEAWMNYR
jgi:hypothetical protein